MPRPLCDDRENVLRGIPEAHWDKEKGRGVSSLFKGPNTSVSRLKIWEKDRIIKKFVSDLRSPPIAAGEINVGVLGQIGNSHGMAITVEEDGSGHNPPHAEVPQKINSKKILLEIVSALTIHLVGPEHR